MCVKPLYIKSNKLDYNQGIDRTGYNVPCGHCFECRLSYRSDYEFRLICHYLSNSNQQCFFYTLTYNDDNLPLLNFFGKEIACFDKPQVQKFIKRLRKDLDADGYQLKYFISSEYGEQKGRPHYHAIFFVSSVYSYRINPIRFRELITKHWKYGFNKPGRNYGVVTSADPLSYVAKYTAKDMYFISKLPTWKQIQDTPLEWVKYNNGTNTYDIVSDYEVAVTEKWYKQRFPFHIQSIGLGLDALEDKEHFKFSDDAFMTSKIRIRLNGKDKTFPIPLYFVRKVLYTTSINSNGNTQYRLNERGYQIRWQQLQERIKIDSDKFRNIVHNIGLIKVPDGETMLSKYYDMCQYLKYSDDMIDFLATYKNFYRGCENMDLTFYNLVEDWKKYVDYQLNHDDFPPYWYVSNNLQKLYNIKALEEYLGMFQVLNTYFAYDSYEQVLNKEKNFKIRYYGTKYDKTKTEEKMDYYAFLHSKFY